MKCYSVRLKSLVQISGKAYRAEDFNGNIDIIPSSQIMGVDYDVFKSEAYWISAWILEKKELTYSISKSAEFKDGKMIPTVTIERHKPEIINKNKEVDSIKELER